MSLSFNIHLKRFSLNLIISSLDMDITLIFEVQKSIFDTYNSIQRS